MISTCRKGHKVTWVCRMHSWTPKSHRHHVFGRSELVQVGHPWYVDDHPVRLSDSPNRIWISGIRIHNRQCCRGRIDAHVGSWSLITTSTVAYNWRRTIVPRWIRTGFGFSRRRLLWRHFDFFFDWWRCRIMTRLALSKLSHEVWLLPHQLNGMARNAASLFPQMKINEKRRHNNFFVWHYLLIIVEEEIYWRTHLLHQIW